MHASEALSKPLACRISAIRNRAGRIVGLTGRVGRAIKVRLHEKEDRKGENSTGRKRKGTSCGGNVNVLSRRVALEMVDGKTLARQHLLQPHCLYTGKCCTCG